MENESIEKFLDNQVKEGYISKDGTPLKCFNCESKELKDNITDSTEQGIMEYEKVCINCNKIVGCWAYGHWQL